MAKIKIDPYIRSAFSTLFYNLIFDLSPVKFDQTRRSALPRAVLWLALVPGTCVCSLQSIYLVIVFSLGVASLPQQTLWGGITRGTCSTGN